MKSGRAGALKPDRLDCSSNANTNSGARVLTTPDISSIKINSMLAMVAQPAPVMSEHPPVPNLH